MKAHETALRGYRGAPSAERVGFGISTGFAAAIAVSRAVNYVRERRRAAPRLRSWWRHLYHAPGQQQLRVHHFLPGIGIAFVAGAAAIFTRDDGHELMFSVPFGVGAGLTLDEVAVLGELDNPYWESERLSLVQSATVALLAGGFGVRFVQRGLRTVLPGRDGDQVADERRADVAAPGTAVPAGSDVSDPYPER